MIRAGRDVVDRHGVAELHGLSPSQAKRAKPWAQPGHPAPVTTGVPTRGRPQLWDREQAKAFATGSPVPALPGVDPEDLLDQFEAAELAGVTEDYWRHRADKRPAADDTVFGIPHWKRSTVETHKQKANANRGGRPSDTGPALRALLQQAEREGRPRPDVAELSTALGVHRTTVQRQLKTMTNTTANRSASTQPSGTPPRPAPRKRPPAQEIP